MRNKIRNLPVRKKIMVAFALPVSILCVVLVLLVYPLVRERYEERVQYSVQQSTLQAGTFVSSYIETMEYLSDLLVSNDSLKKVLNQEDFGKTEGKDWAMQYREFQKISECFSALEISNPLYRFGIYLPDELFYSINHNYIYPLSELGELDEDMQLALDLGGNWITLGSEKSKARVDEQYETLVLYRYVQAHNDIHYITKVSLDLRNVKSVLQNAGITPGASACVVNNDYDVLFGSGNETLIDSVTADRWKELVNHDLQEPVDIMGSKYHVFTYSLEDRGWKLITLTPNTELREQNRMLTIFFFLLGLGIWSIVLLSSHYFSRYIERRLNKLRGKMKGLQEGNINTRFAQDEYNPQGDEFNEIYYDFNFMAEQLRKLMQEHYQMGKNVMSAELKALQAQINPHFLYNTLDLINWTAMDYGSDEIAEISRNLAKFYRLSLNHGKNILQIRDELEHVKAYVEIENFHFEQAIHLEIDVPGEIQEYACPNIIIQPFVENAIVHGIAEFPEITECTIRIRAGMEGKDILFEISDDGMGIPEEQLKTMLPEEMKQNSNGYGVKNINFRLRLYYGEQYGVRYESEEGEGTTVFIRIPALSIQEMEKITNI